MAKETNIEAEFERLFSNKKWLKNYIDYNLDYIVYNVIEERITDVVFKNN
jgi:hypothetical protein